MDWIVKALCRDFTGVMRVACTSDGLGVSQQRACQVIGVDPDDGIVRGRLRKLAAIRRRLGYRRLHLLLQRGSAHEPQEAEKALR